MDKMLSLHPKRTNKQPKTKKKPVKVVYISNPMKVKTSASQFRALVQELTGQDADMPDPSKFSNTESVGGSSQDQEEVSTESKAMEDDVQRKVSSVPEYPWKEILPKRSGHTHTSCEALDVDDDDDDVFTSQMMESFPGVVASNLWYESTHFDELKSLDIM